MSVVPVHGWVGPGLTVRCSVDGWLVVVGSVVVPVSSVCWVSGLDMLRCVCWGCCFLRLRSAGRRHARGGSFVNSVLVLARGDARAKLVVADSPKLMLT